MAGTLSSKSSDKSSGKKSLFKSLKSSETWISPFRHPSHKDDEAPASPEPKKRNLVQLFKDLNNIGNITVPKKFAAADGKTNDKPVSADSKSASADSNSSATSDHKDVESVTASARSSVESRNATATAPSSTQPDLDEKAQTALSKALSDENNVAADAADAEPHQPEVSTSGPADDNIVNVMKETPVAILVPVGTSAEPVGYLDPAVAESFKDHPNMMKRYLELNQAGTGAINRSFDDPNRLIDLGGGLKMTQQQLLDIAAKRVAPVLSDINEAVANTKVDDEVKRQAQLKHAAEVHEKKLQTAFEKFLKKLDKKHEKFDHETDAKLAKLAKESADAETAAKAFEASIKKDIEQAKADGISREEKASKKHEDDIETLERNHRELTATKESDLTEAKQGFVDSGNRIDEIAKDKEELVASNADLDAQIKELQEKLVARSNVLSELKEKHSATTLEIADKETTASGLESSIVENGKAVAAKKTSRDSLQAEVAAVTAILTKYSNKVRSLDADKEARGPRFDEAKKEYADWDSERKQTAREIAAEHERSRHMAIQAAATAKLEAELARKAEQEEAERRMQADAIERERIASEQKRIADEQALAQKQKEEAERKQREQEEAERKQQKLEEEAARKRIAEEERKRKDQEKADAAEAAKEADTASAAAGLMKKEEHAKNEKDAAIARETRDEADSAAAAAGLMKKEEHAAADARASREAEQAKKVEDAQKAKQNATNKAASVPIPAQNKEVQTPVRSGSAPAQHKEVAGVIPASQREISAPFDAAPISGQHKQAEITGQSKDTHAELSSPQVTGTAPVIAVPAAVPMSSSSSKSTSFDSRNDDKNIAPSKSMRQRLKAKLFHTKSQEERAKNAEGGAVSYSKEKSGTDSEYETLSLYEEVTDAEYDSHKKDPDYFAVTESEFAKLHIIRSKSDIPDNVVRKL